MAEEEWVVSHERVVRRATPSKDGKIAGMEKQGAVVRGVVVEEGGVRWLKGPAEGGGPDTFLMIDGESVGLGALLEKVGGGGGGVAAEGDYYVMQGPLFKKPGSDPSTGKVIGLKPRKVGSIVKTTGKTWTGPSGGEWVELDTSTGEKAGWLLVEGPGFNVPGPLLEKAEAGEQKPVVLTLYSMITSSNLCEICVRRSAPIGLVKRWVALKDPHGLKPGKVLISREMPTEEEHNMPSISSFPTHKLLPDTAKIEETPFKEGSQVPYFYMGEASDDGAFDKK